MLDLQRSAGNRAVGRLLAPDRRTGPTVQRAIHGQAGAVQEGYSLRDNEGGPGESEGQWKAPGEAGHSRLMEGAAAEMVEGMAAEGAFDGLMLRHVVPDLSGVPREEKRWATKAAKAKAELDSWTSGFAPGSIRDLWAQQQASANKQVEMIGLTSTELQQKTNQFNSFVPQGNSFYVSAGRLSAMQTMLGATDNPSLASALIDGLTDAEDLMERYQNAYEDGDRRRTSEKLDVPESDQTVESAAHDLTQASRDLDEKYMGFQQVTLASSLGEIKAEYASDEQRMAEIEEVKTFVRNVGKTVDITMSVVRGAPTAAANVSQGAKRARAQFNAHRNRTDILAGRRERFNPTYVTTDASGNMVVRNMQTRMDRDLATGAKSEAPPPSGIELPSSVSDVLGTITDFVYASEVRQINLRLEQMKSRLAAVSAVITTTETQRKITAYQNALNKFAKAAADLQARVEDRRREYREMGTQLDRFAQLDRETRAAGQGVARGAERYTTIMTMSAAVSEALTLGAKSLSAAPHDLTGWWATVRERRISTPTPGETSALSSVLRQLGRFEASVETAREVFGPVTEKSRALLGRY